MPAPPACAVGRCNASREPQEKVELTMWAWTRTPRQSLISSPRPSRTSASSWKMRPGPRRICQGAQRHPRRHRPARCLPDRVHQHSGLCPAQFTSRSHQIRRQRRQGQVHRLDVVFRLDRRRRLRHSGPMSSTTTRSKCRRDGRTSPRSRRRSQGCSGHLPHQFRQYRR